MASITNHKITKGVSVAGCYPFAFAVNGKVFEKGICHPFQKQNNKLANYFLQKQCYQIVVFGGLLKSQLWKTN